MADLEQELEQEQKNLSQLFNDKIKGSISYSSSIEQPELSPSQKAKATVVAKASTVMNGSNGVLG